jgi:hypothetical protein
MLEEGSLARQQILKARRLDEYELGEVQGRGGFATVYQCRLRSNPSIPPLAMKMVCHSSHPFPSLTLFFLFTLWSHSILAALLLR